MKRPELKRPEFRKPTLKMPAFRGPSIKRPALKGPSVKAPAFLADIYYDLRDRRLLPLVCLCVVAIAAVPFLLGDKSETEFTPPLAGAAEEAESSEPTSQLRVVEATPGLRDYHKRLDGRAPTDPFAQQYTQPASGESGSGGATSSSSEGSSGTNSFSEESITVESTTAETGGGEGSSGSGSSGASGGSNGGSTEPGHLVIYDYAIDARISYSPPPGDTSAQQQDPFVEQRILPQTAIPGEKAPVVTYLGPGRNKDNKATGKVLLLVSGDVGQIDGEHRCVSSRSNGLCQLLEVEPGFPLTFAYGEAGAHYTIKVLDIELVVVGHT